MDKLMKCDGGYMFYCHGCGNSHVFFTEPGSKHIWEFNGNMESPTFSPSLLNTWRMCDSEGYREERCHLFVRDGVIEYLSDCTHGFAGKKMEMEDVAPNTRAIDERVKEFAREIVELAHEGTIEPEQVYEIGTRTGVIRIEDKTVPCVPDDDEMCCKCAEYADDGEVVDCYRLNPELFPAELKELKEQP